MSSSVDRDEALRIAREDAERVYGELDAYEVTIELLDGNWKIDYELRDREAQGGGPHYLISAASGELVDRRYEQ